MANVKNKQKAAARQQLILNGLADELDEIREQADVGRKHMWKVFANAYVWHHKSLNVMDLNGNSYLEQVFLSHSPKITAKTGVSEFNRLAKLAFKLNDPRFAPTVSRYSAAFDYIDRVIEAKDKKNADHIVGLIDDAGGIHGCAKFQKHWVDEQNGPQRIIDKQAEQDLLDKRIEKLKKKKTKGTIKATVVEPAHGFVLLLGRPTKQPGEYKVVDVLENVSDSEMEELLMGSDVDG